MIDYAFANNLHIKNHQHASVLKPQSLPLISSYRYLQSSVWYIGTWDVGNFSKYNVGLVWYYYNLWSFNFIIGFAGVLIALTFMSNIVFGLIVRLLECTALLLCLGPIVGMWPLDDGNAFKSWRKTFVSDVLMAYGAVVGMNLLFLLFPYIQKITFFTSPIANYVMNALVTLVMLLAVKQLIKMLSNFIGAADAHDVGKSTKAEAGKAAIVAADKAMALVQVGAKIAKLFPATAAIAKGVGKVADKIREVTAKKAMEAKANKTSAGDNSPVEVGAGTMEKLKEQEIEKLQNEAEQKGFEADEANEAVEEAENKEMADESKASRAETKKFGKWLNDPSKADSFTGDNEKDSDLANRLMGEYQDEMEKSKDASDEDKEKIKQKYLEAFREQNSHAEKVDQIKETRSDRHAAQQADQDKIAQQIKDIQENGVEGFVLTERAQNRAARSARNAARGAKVGKFLGSDSFKGVLKFAGDNLKVIGGAVGFDNLIDKLKGENGAIDKGKLVIRDFAQSLGVGKVANAKSLRTFKEKEDDDKEEIQAKVVDNTGVKESEDLLGAINNLGKVLKGYKKK